MQESVLSARRVPTSPVEALAGAGEDHFAGVSLDGAPGGDGSKTRRSASVFAAAAAARARRLAGRVGALGPWCLALSLVFFVLSLASSSRAPLCSSPYPPLSRFGFFGVDGVDADFGALGVPWCKRLPTTASILFLHIHI